MKELQERARKRDEEKKGMLLSEVFQKQEEDKRLEEERREKLRLEDIKMKQKAQKEAELMQEKLRHAEEDREKAVSPDSGLAPRQARASPFEAGDRGRPRSARRGQRYHGRFREVQGAHAARSLRLAQARARSMARGEA